MPTVFWTRKRSLSSTMAKLVPSGEMISLIGPRGPGKPGSGGGQRQRQRVLQPPGIVSRGFSFFFPLLPRLPRIQYMSTYVVTLSNEGHTLGFLLSEALQQDPRVQFAGYNLLPAHCPVP